MKVLAVALLAALAAPAALADVSLGVLAQKERLRRSALKPIGRVYDNEDLGRYVGTVSVSYEPLAPGGAAGVATAPQGPTGDQLRAEKKAGFEQQIASNERRKASIRKVMDTAQLELNDLGNYTYGTRRASLIQLLENGDKEIQKLDAANAEIEEQARRAGISVSR